MQPGFINKPKEQLLQPTTEQKEPVDFAAEQTSFEHTLQRRPDISRDQAELARRIQQQAVPRPAARLPKTPLRRELEVVLAEDVFDFMKQAPAAQQIIIRQRGREVLDEIETMIKQTKINIRKIIKLILSWLKLLPITNKYFLEQAAKIKTEEILKIADMRRQK